MNSDIAGQYTDGLISVQQFKDYQTTRITPITLTDEDVEKYIITATNILNSFTFLGVIPKRYIIYRGILSKEGPYINNPLGELIGKRILIKTTDANYVGVVTIQDNIEKLKIIFDEEYPDFTDLDCEIISDYTSYHLHSYTQRCSFPRPLFGEFIIPNNIKIFLCELVLLLTKEDFYSKKQDNVKKAVLDVLETEYFENSPSSINILPFALQSLLKPFLDTGGLVVTKFVI